MTAYGGLYVTKSPVSAPPHQNKSVPVNQSRGLTVNIQSRRFVVCCVVISRELSTGAGTLQSVFPSTTW